MFLCYYSINELIFDHINRLDKTLLRVFYFLLTKAL